MISAEPKLAPWSGARGDDRHNDNHVRSVNMEPGAITYDLIEDRPVEKIVTASPILDLGYSARGPTLSRRRGGTRVQITSTARCRIYSSGWCRVLSSGTQRRSKNICRPWERNSAKMFRRSLKSAAVQCGVRYAAGNRRSHSLTVTLRREGLAERRPPRRTTRASFPHRAISRTKARAHLSVFMMSPVQRGVDASFVQIRRGICRMARVNFSSMINEPEQSIPTHPTAALSPSRRFSAV